jgi:hypothetical protein
VTGGGGTNSILQFRFERGYDGTKRCRKMKRMHRACLDSMGRKHDTMRWHGNVGRRRGDIGEGKGMRRRQLD